MVDTQLPRVLLVEDSPIVSRALKHSLEANGYEVATVTTPNDALKAVDAHPPDLMILDLTLESECFDSFRDGFSLLYWLRQTRVAFPVIIYTVDKSPSVDERARGADAFAVVRKGNNTDNILDAVRQAFETIAVEK